MELIKITDMAKQFNVSSKTLRYYEEMGILESSRLKENRYRYYSIDAVERLKQILILRKMQIPIKDIILIFKNQTITQLLESFEKKLSQIEHDMSALLDLKGFINDFLQKLREHGIQGGNGIKLLYEAAEQNIDTYTMQQKVSCDRLEQINDQLARLSDTDVRIQQIPKMRVVSYKPVNMWFDTSPVRSWLVEKGFAYTPGCKETFNLKDYAIFKIPFDFINDSKYEDFIFEGGLYAIVSNSMEDGNKKQVMLEKWIQESGIFEIDKERSYMNECTTDADIMEKYMELADTYIPLKYKDSCKYTLQDTGIANYHVVNRDIIKLNHFVIDEEIVYNLKEDELSIKCPSDYHFLKTPMRYKLPLKIDITAKVDSTNLRIGFGKAQLIFNWEFDLDYLCFSDPYNSNMKIDNKTSCNGRLTQNVYHDILWIMDKDFMAVLVDGEIRLCKSGFPYQQFLKENSEKGIKDNIRIGSAFHSEVTLKSLAVSELAV